MKIMKVNLLGMFFGATTFASLLLPRWSIRASGVSIDISPFAARP